MEFSLVVTTLLILAVVIATLAFRRRPTEPVTIATQAVAVIFLAVDGVITHRYIGFIFVLIAVMNIYRRTRAWMM